MAVLTLAASAGCNPLAGFVYQSEHFRWGTTVERELSQPVDHVYKNVQFALKERNFSIRKAEMPNDEFAQIWSSKDGQQLVVDIKGAGQGCVVHLEVDQVGADQLATTLLTDIEMLP